MRVDHAARLGLGSVDAAVQREVGSHCPIRHEPLPQDDPRVRRPDITRAREVLGWEPKVPFEEGLRRSVEWFRGRVANAGAAARALP